MRRLGLTTSLVLISTAAFAPGAQAATPKAKAKAVAAQPTSEEGVRINGVTYSDKGTVAPPQSMRDLLPPELALRLKKIFLFPSIDDLSGALAPKLDEKLAELFNHNTRFELIRDQQVVKALSPDEASYYKAALNQDVHKEAAKVTGADTTVLLRTRNLGADTRMVLEIRDAHGNLLYSEEGSVPGNSNMDARWALIEKLYRSMLARFPFEGTVTGRTARTLTVDLGVGSMKPNEVIEIARIVSVQRHPLLGTVVGTDYVRTGRAKVTSVDRVLSFAEVIEEFPGEKVGPGQKVLRAQAAVVHRGGPDAEPEDTKPKRRNDQESSANSDLGSDAPKEENPLDQPLKGSMDHPRPRFGQVSANLYYGSVANEQTFSGTETPFGGSGVGGDLGGELWVTKNWILALSYGFQSVTLSTNNVPAGSGTWDQLGFTGGYRIFPEGMAEGIVLTGSFGYEAVRLRVPGNAALHLGERRFTGPVLKVDGEVGFLENQRLSAGFSIVPFVSVTDAVAPLGTSSGGTIIGVNLAWNRSIMDQLWLKVGLHYDVVNANYEDSTSGLSLKRFAIGPGIYYQF